MAKKTSVEGGEAKKKASPQTPEEKFIALYVSLDKAFGQWSTRHGASTVRKAAKPLQWKNHFGGKKGLGLVPITTEDKCSWGAIDIDVNDINHKALAKKVEKLKLPLVVCRSKSGGAHCYTFTKNPVKASILRQTLSACAFQLGHGKAEIFPKQDKIRKGEVGNWINIPYFNLKKTIRYGVDSKGKTLTLEEYVTAAEVIKKTHKPISKKNKTIGGMPPCLEHFSNNPIEHGCRNEVFFNYAVYFRRRYSTDWEEKLYAVNYRDGNGAGVISKKEMNSVVSSVSKKEYGYRCTGPIGSYCDRIHCQTLQFGVKIVNANYGELMIGALAKMMTDPPTWIIEINGFDLELSTEEIMNYKIVRTRCMEKIDLIAPPMKGEEWMQLLRERMDNKRIIDAPEDASQDSQIIHAFAEYLALSERTTDRKDIFRGLPVKIELPKKGQVIIFRSDDFSNRLKQKKVVYSMSNQKLWLLLRKYGAGDTIIKIDGRNTRVWYVRVDEQEGMPKLELHREESEV